MTTQKLPGADAARHGAGDADLTIMIAAHNAFRRDLTRLARTAAAADLADPARRRSIAAGWNLFKRELHIHHTAEDEIIWPVLRPRLAHSEAALSVLDAMEEEHERIEPLLTAVDAAFAQRMSGGVAGSAAGGAVGGAAGSAAGGAVGRVAGSAAGGAVGGVAGPADDDWPGEDRLADVIDVLASTLTGHLRHEERDGLPLIGVALTAAEWRRVGFKMVRRNGMSAGGEMFAWILDGADPGAGRAADSDAGRAAALGQLPPPLRLLYRAVWKPRYDKTPRW